MQLNLKGIKTVFVLQRAVTKWPHKHDRICDNKITVQWSGSCEAQLVSTAMRPSFSSVRGPVCQNMAAIYYKPHLNIDCCSQLHPSEAVFKSRYQVLVIELSTKLNLLKRREKSYCTSNMKVQSRWRISPKLQFLHILKPW